MSRVAWPAPPALTPVSAGMIATVGLALLTAVPVSILTAFQASALRPLPVLKATSGTSSARGFELGKLGGFLP